jgi:uncharacterized protein YjiS (DUF1127 family)
LVRVAGIVRRLDHQHNKWEQKMVVATSVAAFVQLPASQGKGVDARNDDCGRTKTMTLLITTRPQAAITIRRRLYIILAHLGRLVDDLVVAILADLARRAEMAELYGLSDRELKDIGIYRCQIDGGLAEAARDRLQQQRAMGA